MNGTPEQIQTAQMRAALDDLTRRFADALDQALDILAEKFGSESSRDLLTSWQTLSGSQRKRAAAKIQAVLLTRLAIRGGGPE